MIFRPLKGFGAFDAVFRRGRRFTAGPVGLTIETSSSAEPPDLPIRVGVTVGRRTAKLAVVRTRIRRLLREAIRSVLERHEREFRDHHVTTLILVWRSAPSRPSRIGLADVEPHVEAVVMKALDRIRSERKEAS